MRLTLVRIGFFATLLIFTTVGSVIPVAAMQRGTAWCDAAFLSPNVPLDSIGLGLTQSELDSLYGPGLAAQEFMIYDRGGYSLALSNCNLEVDLDADGPYTDRAAAGRLARALLPEDAVNVGTTRFGNMMSRVIEFEEWISPSLAIRYRELAQTRTGSILVVYTASLVGPADMRVSLIQLATLGVPR